MKKADWISRIKFICFDLDGTLYRSVPEVWQAIRGQVVDRIAEHQKSIRQEADDYLMKRYQALGSTTKVLKELGIDAEAFFTRMFNGIDLTKYVKPDIRLAKLLESLKKKYRLGIISNNGRLGVKKKLKAVGLPLKLFNPVISTYDIGVLKPDPTPFLEALEAAGVSPEESVYVGDREKTDILGAKAVGMRTIMVWGKSQEADLSLATIYDLERIFL